MREIEVKAKVANVHSVIQRLQDDGKNVSDPIMQRDQVFGLAGEDGDDDNHAPWLRIRTETKNNQTSYLFTLKKSVTNQLDSIEHETEISNPLELEQIILHSGFEPYSDITKTRRKVKVGASELCMDEVDHLGNFVEAEKLTGDTVDYDAVVAELWQLLEQYGVSRANQVTDGYDVMIKKLKQST